MDVFNCPSCQQALWDPVTVRCGHSFCKGCLRRPAVDRCHVCKQKLKPRGAQELKCNTLLCNLLEKCLQSETRLNRVRSDLRDLLSLQVHEEAAKVASRGVAMGRKEEKRQALEEQK
ncbi:LON peptidase N-terminal domain and RING finger protein 2-like isoform X1 [Spea bombifrons]|uniref:LON peptidase N-terminal domain and RING finger protein 2-like isoform X1 n=1 Tax=Spea bombifrons TaxID=233779 RepID=UPI00234B489C|nr:LON peptidase N-terminal domain and RING finger protein 2-like isoform X1 [Spea bombifrons]